MKGWQKKHNWHLKARLCIAFFKMLSLLFIFIILIYHLIWHNTWQFDIIESFIQPRFIMRPYGEFSWTPKLISITWSSLLAYPWLFHGVTCPCLFQHVVLIFACFLSEFHVVLIRLLNRAPFHYKWCEIFHTPLIQLGLIKHAPIKG